MRQEKQNVCWQGGITGCLNSSWQIGHSKMCSPIMMLFWPIGYHKWNDTTSALELDLVETENIDDIRQSIKQASRSKKMSHKIKQSSWYTPIILINVKTNAADTSTNQEATKWQLNLALLLMIYINPGALPNNGFASKKWHTLLQSIKKSSCYSRIPA